MATAAVVLSALMMLTPFPTLAGVRCERERLAEPGE